MPRKIWAAMYRGGRSTIGIGGSAGMEGSGFGGGNGSWAYSNQLRPMKKTSTSSVVDSSRLFGLARPGGRGLETGGDIFVFVEEAHDVPGRSDFQLVLEPAH